MTNDTTQDIDGDLAKMRVLEEAPLTTADEELFLLNGEIWLRSRYETKFHKGAVFSQVASNPRAVSESASYDLVLDGTDPRAASLLADLGVNVVTMGSYLRASFDKTEVAEVERRGIVYSHYPMLPAPRPEKDAPKAPPELDSEGGLERRDSIFFEGFEGAWPGPWSVGDWNPTNGADYWGDASCQSHSGSWSGWCSDEGNMTDCSSYDNYMEAYLTSPGINVGAYEDVQLSFAIKYDTEPCCDELRRYYSSDGTSWVQSTATYSGSSDGWIEQVVSLNNFTTYYTRFVFESDYSVNYPGVYLDDIRVMGTPVDQDLPNLRPYTPAGWDYPIVPSSVSGTTTVGPLFADQPTYIDVAVANDGNADADDCYTALYIDGTYVTRWLTDDLQQGYYAYVLDYSRTLSAGWHELALVADYLDQIEEDDEQDNEYSHDFYWDVPTDPEITGWDLDPDDPIVWPGDSFIIRYQITNENPIPMTGYLHFRTRSESGHYEFLQDQYGDYSTQVTLQPGTNWYERDGIVYDDAEGGIYRGDFIVSPTSNWADAWDTEIVDDLFEVLGQELELLEPHTDLSVIRGEQIEFQWVGSGPPGSFVNLFRDDDTNYDNGVTWIVGVGFPTSGAIDWDTSDVPDGEYRVGAVIITNVGGGELRETPVYSPGTVTIGPIALSLWNPSQDLEIGPGSDVFISWTSETVGTSFVRLYYDLDDDPTNGNEELISQPALPEDGDWNWDTEGITPGTYYVLGSLSNQTDTVYDYAPGVVTILSNPPGDISVTPLDLIVEQGAQSGRPSVPEGYRGWDPPDLSRPHVDGELVVKFRGDQMVRFVREAGELRSSLADWETVGAQAIVKGVQRINRSANLPLALRNRFVITIAEGTELEHAIEVLLKLPEVESIVPNYVYEGYYIPNDEDFDRQWHLAKIRAPQAWDLGDGDEQVVVGVLDTGVDWDHPDLETNIWTNNDEIDGNGIDDDGNGYVDDVRGYDFVSAPGNHPPAPDEDVTVPDADPMDRHGHGSHCAGIVAAVTNNTIGVAGVVPRCKVMPLRVGYGDADGDSWMLFAAVASAVDYAICNGASVISMSFGGGPEILDDVTAAYNSGVVVCHAAGNDNSSSPSAIDGIPQTLSVAATDRNDRRAVWDEGDASNYGIWVDVSAPGDDILSTIVDTYASWSGTSMACPVVAGIAAAVVAARPGIDVDAVVSAIVDNTDDIDDLNPGFEGMLGSGRVNMLATLASVAQGVQIANIGYDDIQVQSITDDSPWLSHSGYPTTPFNLAPDQSQSVNVSVDWSLVGESGSRGYISIASDDPDEPIVQVEVEAVPDVTAPPAPIDLTVIPDDWHNVPLFEIDWADPDDQTGIVAAWYKLGSAPAAPSDGTRTMLHPFDVNATSEGGQLIYVWLEDGAGNRDHTQRSDVQLLYDGTAPSIVVTAPLPGTDVTPGGLLPIAWIPATDSGGSGLPPNPVTILVSLDATSFEPVAQGLPNSGNFAWPVPQDLPGPQIWIRVAAEDVAGNHGSDDSGPIDVSAILGACCLADGTCQEMSEGECMSEGGSYQGDGSICDPGSPVLASPSNEATCVSTTARLDWDDVVGATGYRLQVGTACGAGTQVEVGESSYDFQADSGTLYFWRVASRNSCDTYGSYSDCFWFEVARDPLDPPVLLSPDDGSLDVLPPILLDWADVPNAIGYGVLVGTACGTGTAVEVAGSEYEFDATPGVTYFWQVRSKNACDAFGAYSECFSFTTASNASGACCIDAFCEVMTQAECQAASGTYVGNGITCDPDPCSAVGACCLSDGTCQEMMENECLNEGGVYRGNNTSCVASPEEVADATGNGYGIVFQGPTPSFVSECLGEALLTDQRATRGVVLADDGLRLQEFTIEGYVRWTGDFSDGSGSRTIVDKFSQGSDAGRSWGIWVDKQTRQLFAQVFFDSNNHFVEVRDPDPLPDGMADCVHVALTAKANGTVCIYRDGLLRDSADFSSRLVNYELNSNLNFANAGNDNAAFWGTLDDFRLSDIARTSFAVGIPHAFDSNTVALWRFDGGCPTGACCLFDGTCQEMTELQCSAEGGVYRGNNTSCTFLPSQIPDASGNEHGIVFQGSVPEFVDDCLGAALLTDQTTTRGVVAADDAFDLQEFTIEGYIRWDGGSPNGSVIADKFTQWTDEGRSWGLYVDPSTRQLFARVLYDANNHWVEVRDSDPLPEGMDDCVHVALTVKADDAVRLYRDGFLKASADFSARAVNYQLSADLNFANAGNDNAAYFGTLEDFRLSNIARTSFAVGSPHEVDANTVALWRFDGPCPVVPVGACCLIDGTCVEVSEAACEVADGHYPGSWQGDGSSCEPGLCQDISNSPEDQVVDHLMVGTLSPNPSRDSIRFAVGLPKRERVRVEMFDASGRLVDVIFAGELTQGFHQFDWSRGNRPSGSYYIQTTAGAEKVTRNLVLTR